MKNIIITIILAIAITSCHQHDHSGHAHGEEDSHEGHTHGEDSHDHDSGCEHDVFDYHPTEIKKSSFYETIKTSGEILPAQGDEIVISARHTGIVLFNQKKLFEGSLIEAGQTLFTISGSELLHDNMEAGFIEAKNNFEKEKRNYDRAIELRKDTIISEKEFLEINTTYENAKYAFEIIKKNYVKGGQNVVAPERGYIKEINITEGEFVETGKVLITLSKNKKLVIRADVSQRYFNKLHTIHSANFITPYDGSIYDIKDLNGELISFGKTTGDISFYTPVFFEINNSAKIIPGTYIDVYLKCKKMENVIILPKQAILEEFGHNYVYAKHLSEYEKRYIKINGSDGYNVLIKSGLSEKDTVATANVYHLKLKSMSSALPAHTHSH